MYKLYRCCASAFTILSANMRKKLNKSRECKYKRTAKRTLSRIVEYGTLCKFVSFRSYVIRRICVCLCALFRSLHSLLGLSSPFFCCTCVVPNIYDFQERKFTENAKNTWAEWLKSCLLKSNCAQSVYSVCNYLPTKHAYIGATRFTNRLMKIVNTAELFLFLFFSFCIDREHRRCNNTAALIPTSGSIEQHKIRFFVIQCTRKATKSLTIFMNKSYYCSERYVVLCTQNGHWSIEYWDLKWIRLDGKIIGSDGKMNNSNSWPKFACMLCRVEFAVFFFN